MSTSIVDLVGTIYLEDDLIPGARATPSLGRPM
jgi:hypothetical protein